MHVSSVPVVVVRRNVNPRTKSSTAVGQGIGVIRIDPSLTRENLGETHIIAKIVMEDDINLAAASPGARIGTLPHRSLTLRVARYDCAFLSALRQVLIMTSDVASRTQVRMVSSNQRTQVSTVIDQSLVNT